VKQPQSPAVGDSVALNGKQKLGTVGLADSY
jgi:hypothetical protein